MVTPIRPCDVKLIIPDFVIEAVNKLIQEKWDGDEARVEQFAILNVICSEDPDDGKPSRSEVYDKHWLDIEDTYRKAGWIVTYDQPTYGDEAFEPYFIFKPKKKK
jgi:hypothetical protein